MNRPDLSHGEGRGAADREAEAVSARLDQSAGDAPGRRMATLLQAIDHAETVEALQLLASELPGMQQLWVRGGLDAEHQARAVTGIVDALTGRLITLAEAMMTPAPGPYAWLACGSQGRFEQTVHTDQDNALIYADDLPPEADAWFQRLGEFVTDGLAACGIPHCPGGVSPRSADWRHPVARWRKLLHDAVKYPERKAVMLASHYFDLRVIHGDALLFEPVQEAARQAAACNRLFLLRAAENALRSTAGLGLLRRLQRVGSGEHAGHVGLKHGGLLPISQLALNYALQGALPQKHTLERLRAASDAGIASNEGIQDLIQAYRTITDQRARHLARCTQQRRPHDNYLRPRESSQLALRQLRDAYAVIPLMQKSLRLGIGT